METIKLSYWEMAAGAGFGYISYFLFYSIGIFLANILANPADFGNYSVTITTMFLLATLIIFGHNRYILKLYPQYQKQGQLGILHGYIRRVIQISLIGGIIIAIVVAATYEGYQELVNPQHQHPIVVGTLFAPIIALTLFALEILNVNKRFLLSTFINKVLLPISVAIFISIFVLIGYINDTTAVLATGIAWVLSLAICMANMLSTPYKAIVATKPIYQTKRWFSSSAPYWVYQIAFISMNSLPIIFLEILHAKEVSVGIFAAAFQTASFLNLFAASTNRYLLPIISEYFDCYREVQSILFKRRKFLLLGCSTYLILIILVGDLVLRLFGDQYTLGYPELVISVVGIYIQVLFAITPYICEYFKITKQIVTLQIAMIAMSIILYFALIPKFGGLGAALGFAASVIAAGVYQAIFLYKKTGLRVI